MEMRNETNWLTFCDREKYDVFRPGKDDPRAHTPMRWKPIFLDGEPDCFLYNYWPYRREERSSENTITWRMQRNQREFMLQFLKRTFSSDPESQVPACGRDMCMFRILVLFVTLLSDPFPKYCFSLSSMKIPG